MPRTRTISQTKALFVSPTGILPVSYGLAAGGVSGYIPSQINKVDSFSFDVDLAGGRTDIIEFGQLGRVGVVKITELSPSVKFSYFVGDGKNENNLGFNMRGLNISGSTFTASSQFISGFLSEATLDKEKNLYLVTTRESVDAFDTTFPANRTEHNVTAFGNVVIQNYSASFSVGEIPKVDIEAECGNIIFFTGQSSGLKNPALIRSTAAIADTGLFVIPQPNTGEGAVDVLRAGDLSFSVGGSTSLGGVDYGQMIVQSITFDVPLARKTIERLGDELPFAKPLEFPITLTCSINALTSDLKSGALTNLLTGCVAGGSSDINLQVKNRCDENSTVLGFMFKGAILDSQNFSQSIDGEETVDLVFSSQILGATNTTQGLFATGSVDLTGNNSTNSKLAINLGTGRFTTGITRYASQ